MLEKYIESEITFVIENIINDISNYQNDLDTTQAIEKLNQDDISIITNKLLNSTYFITELNSFVDNSIEDEIYNYVHEKESE